MTGIEMLEAMVYMCRDVHPNGWSHDELAEQIRFLQNESIQQPTVIGQELYDLGFRYVGSPVANEPEEAEVSRIHFAPIRGTFTLTDVRLDDLARCVVEGRFQFPAKGES